MKRFYFNMIEIILAIAILSIGISSVMVLFTSGVKANNSSTAASMLPDAVESAVSRIRFLAAHYASGASDWGDYVNNMGTSYVTENISAFVPLTPDEALVPNTRTHAQYNFLYRQLSQDESGNQVVNFSAVIRVKKRVQDGVIVNPVNGTTVSDPSAYTTHLNNSFRVVDLEISYPADIPMTARKVKYFRVELFNDMYNRINP